jgi:phage-related baseplate assembly protein
MSSVVDLTHLPPPAIVETLDFESLLATLKADLAARAPALAPVLALESEPLVKLLEVAAWREMEIRARVNAAARAILLPWAAGADLDNIAARYGVARLLGEDDERLRARVLIAYHQLAGAGSVAGWRFHTLSAHPDVVAADVWSPRPGAVTVAVLARAVAHKNNCTAEQQAVGRALFGTHPNADMRYIVAHDVHAAPLADVVARLMSEEVMPLTIDLRVIPAEIVPYTVTAHLIVPIGQDAALIAQESRARLVRDALSRAAFRVDVHRAAIIGALMEARVRDVQLTAPAADIAIGPGQIAVMTDATITAEVAYD